MNKLNPMQVLLSVVDPEYPYTVPINEVIKDKALLKSTIKLAQRNGLYYYFICKLKELNMDIPLSEADRWKEENHRLSELKATIRLLNKISENHGINYVIIKACNTIPHIPRDVDVFVRKEDRAIMIKSLEDEGIKPMQIGTAETSLKCDYLKVDVYTKICYFGMDFIDGDFLLRSSVEDEVFGVEYSGLNNEVNFLLLLVHGLFGHRSISLLDFSHLNNIRSNININTCGQYAHRSGWGLVFDLALNELNTICKRIYEKGEVIRFPYLFDQRFISRCISEIEGLNMGKYNEIFLYITLAQDKIIFELKDTPVYNLLKSFEPIRNLVNSLTAAVKVRRGDVKSVDKESGNK